MASKFLALPLEIHQRIDCFLTLPSWLNKSRVCKEVHAYMKSDGWAMLAMSLKIQLPGGAPDPRPYVEDYVAKQAFQVLCDSSNINLEPLEETPSISYARGTVAELRTRFTQCSVERRCVESDELISLRVGRAIFRGLFQDKPGRLQKDEALAIAIDRQQGDAIKILFGVEQVPAPDLVRRIMQTGNDHLCLMAHRDLGAPFSHQTLHGAINKGLWQTVQRHVDAKIQCDDHATLTSRLAHRFGDVEGVNFLHSLGLPRTTRLTEFLDLVEHGLIDDILQSPLLLHPNFITSAYVWAAHYNRENIVRLLLQRNVPIHPKALAKAISVANPALLELLMEHLLPNRDVDFLRCLQRGDLEEIRAQIAACEADQRKIPEDAFAWASLSPNPEAVTQLLVWAKVRPKDRTFHQLAKLNTVGALLVIVKLSGLGFQITPEAKEKFLEALAPQLIAAVDADDLETVLKMVPLFKTEKGHLFPLEAVLKALRGGKDIISSAFFGAGFYTDFSLKTFNKETGRIAELIIDFQKGTIPVTIDQIMALMRSIRWGARANVIEILHKKNELILTPDSVYDRLVAMVNQHIVDDDFESLQDAKLMFNLNRRFHIPLSCYITTIRLSQDEIWEDIGHSHYDYPPAFFNPHNQAVERHNLIQFFEEMVRSKDSKKIQRAFQFLTRIYNLPENIKTEVHESAYRTAIHHQLYDQIRLLRGLQIPFTPLNKAQAIMTRDAELSILFDVNSGSSARPKRKDNASGESSKSKRK